MSDEREQHSNKFSNDEVKPDDVEAHVRAAKTAAIDAPDEVKSVSAAGDDGESDDDVTAHVKTNRN